MKLPVAAIIGRPNVGKSTLFNRLLKKRSAIVDDQPGVTRDSKMEKLVWNGVAFSLMDTGGFLPNTDDIFLTAIKEQVERAVAETDLLIFLTDAKEGVTPIDEEIARIVRRSGKENILVVNKVDSQLVEPAVYDFYALGLIEPLAISAMNGRSTGDLLDLIVQHLPEKVESKEEVEPVHLTIIGKPNVGKSSFVNRLLGEKKVLVTEIPGTTRDSIDSHFRSFGYNFVLIDTAGLRKRAKIDNRIEYYSTVRTMQSIDRSDVTIVLINAQDGLGHQDMAVVSNAVSRNKGVVLVVNKWDLIAKDTKTMQTTEKELRLSLKNLDYIPIIMISCKTNLRVHQVIHVALSVYQERKKRISTSELNDRLGPVLRDKPPLVKDSKPVKVHYLTQVKANPPVFALFTNRPQVIAPNYKRFIEKRIREQFGFLGVPLTIAVRKK
ncbi:MAG TPA: ribosome biogenesis GTPase Der [Bacteroidetes bacterium]|nr:ribosome biogenesis GTPase Der [Bacteroidota bacterium]